MPKKSQKKQAKRTNTKKPKTKPKTAGAGLAVPLENIRSVIASQTELASLPEPRTFDEANHWLIVHKAWIDRVTEVSTQVLGAATATKSTKARLDSKKLLEYIEQLSELALVTAKAQRSTESLTRCFVQ